MDVSGFRTEYVPGQGYDANGNALAYASLVALFKPGPGNEEWRAYGETKQSSHKALANILEAMQEHRKV